MPTTRRFALKDTLAAIYTLMNVAQLTTLATGGIHHGRAPQGTQTALYVATGLQVLGGAAVLVGAHQSIGLKAIVLMGNEQQKKQFLPRLAKGEILAAFCLERKLTPRQVRNRPELLEAFQALLRREGVELSWPRLTPL